MDPIVANSIKSGEERGDGKDQISLAVSSLRLSMIRKRTLLSSFL